MIIQSARLRTQNLSVRELKKPKFSPTIDEEIEMINDKNVALLNQCLILVSLFTHINTKISNLERMNMNDGYLNGKKLNYEKLKTDFVEHALLTSNQNLDESKFEQIIERGKTLIRELRNYEMVKSQTAILNDWLDNDSLLEKALPLDGRIQEFVEQIDSSKLTEQKRYFLTRIYRC